MSLSKKLSYQDVDVKDKRVLIRVDFNVPLDNAGTVTNPQRIVGAKTTIDHVRSRGAKAVVLMSHLGRPDGQPNKKYSLRQIVPEVEKVLGTSVTFAEDCVGSATEELVNKTTGGGVVLLENLRFHVEEEGKGVDSKGEKVKAGKEEVEAFRKGLTKLGDVYINDAFGTAHRAHSSMVGIALPQRAAGSLMKTELDYFAAALEAPKRKFIAIMGGSKVSDKIKLIENLLQKVDILIIGGAMTYTFKSVPGQGEQVVKIGGSRFDEEGSKLVPGIRSKAAERGVKLLLPDDHVIASEFKDGAGTKIVSDAQGIPDGWMGVDIGPQSIKSFHSALTSPDTKTILWNGPPGVFELQSFAKGTEEMARSVIEATQKGATSIIGGGDTATAAAKFGAEGKVSHISTGGGASLELLEGKELPGVTALSEK
ncbi:MAG: hypothetical protein Q9162_006705 [Coniocarpon cinnabarinum]